MGFHSLKREHTCSNERCRVGRTKAVWRYRNKKKVREDRPIADEPPRRLCTRVMKSNYYGTKSKGAVNHVAHFLGPLPYCTLCHREMEPARREELAMENERRRTVRVESHHCHPREDGEGVLDAQGIITQVHCFLVVRVISSFKTLLICSLVCCHPGRRVQKKLQRRHGLQLPTHRTQRQGN